MMEGILITGRERRVPRDPAAPVARLRRGLHAVPGDEQRQRVAAAAHRLDAVASHETAARLWGIPTLRHPGPAVHLTRRRRCQGTARYPDVQVHHASLDAADVTVHCGVPVTAPARTVLDLARGRSLRSGVVAADAALRMRHCTREELHAVAQRCRRWPGIARARDVVLLADPRSASPLESISRVVFHVYRLPRPILQAVIGGYERADFLWPDQWVIGEADGLDKYTSPEVLRREKSRQEGFAQLGFVVFRWTWRDAYHRPDALAYRAEQVLARGQRSFR